MIFLNMKNTFHISLLYQNDIDGKRDVYKRQLEIQQRAECRHQQGEQQGAASGENAEPQPGKEDVYKRQGL